MTLHSETSSTSRNLSTPRTAVRAVAVAALVCGLAWVGKVLLIASNGGENTDTGLVAVGWGLGLLGLLATGAALGYLAARRFGKPAAVLAAVAGIPVAFVVMNVADTVAKAVYTEPGWFRDELSLLALGSICLFGGLLVLRSGGRD